MRVVATPTCVRENANVWIPMPDGVRLAARMWLPDAVSNLPVPAILEYIPYRKRDGTAWRDALTQPYIAGHGYAVLRVDVRGTGDSEGILTDEYTAQEHDDGLAVIAWIASQAWCTGKVGMIGLSWGGFNSLQIAARRPPALAAIISLCASDDRYSDDAHYMGGCILGEQIVWGTAILAQAALPPDPEIVGSDWREQWLARLEATPRWVATWLSHQRRDDYWRHGSVNENYGAIVCPVFAVGGWADAYRNFVPRLLANLKAPSKGLVGPWAHGWPHLGEPGPAIGFLQEALSWWDHWLKGIDTGFMDEPRYRVWMPPPSVAGGGENGRWVAEATWPSDRVEPQRLVLNPGRLGNEPEPEIALTHCSSQITGSGAGSWCPYGSGDLARDQRIDDGLSLTFDSLPLAEGIEILGPPILEMEIAVDRPLAFVVARLCDVDASGASTRVTYGVLNLSHRRSDAEPETAIPGDRMRIRLQLNDIAYAFALGHRVRLALSTSYWPIVWPSPAPATLTVFTGSASSLLLPVRPESPSDASLRAMGKPEGAPEPPMTTLEPAESSSTWRYDLDSNSAELAGEINSGLERFDDIGTAVGTAIRYSYVINTCDPLSATTSFAWVIRRERPGWKIRIEAAIELRSTDTDFNVLQSLRAFEQDNLIFAQECSDSLSRDLV